MTKNKFKYLSFGLFYCYSYNVYCIFLLLLSRLMLLCSNVQRKQYCYITRVFFYEYWWVQFVLTAQFVTVFTTVGTSHMLIQFSNVYTSRTELNYSAMCPWERLHDDLKRARSSYHEWLSRPLKSREFFRVCLKFSVRDSKCDCTCRPRLVHMHMCMSGCLQQDLC